MTVSPKPYVQNNTIDYRRFIESNFCIKTKHGEIVPFIFNDVQNLWYDQLLEDYGPDLQGVRENDLKGRQFGISSVIAAIFTTDFILAGNNEIPMRDSVLYSHKDKETASHFARVNMFLDSALIRQVGGSYTNPAHRLEAIPKLRPAFLETDTTNLLVAKNGVQIQTATAGAKVSGRGSTLQNIHWSEVAFYPNTEILDAETLVTGAEEQVPDNYGKIFRESTGNMAGDYFSKEYYLGKDGQSDFHSRFLAWYLHKAYTREAPQGWRPPTYYSRLIKDGQATIDQCFWHYKKTRELTDKKKRREYPSTDTEAFLMAGTGFFDELALLYHNSLIKKPIKESMYVQAL
jgi:hypothetical protein